MWNKIYQGSAKEILKTFPDESVDCCISSPPYYSLLTKTQHGGII